jgi:hypothetical protein
MLLENHVKPEDWKSLCTSLNLELITLYESQKALSLRKFMFKFFLFASVVIPSIGISILAISLKIQRAFLILYIIILWLLVTLLLVVPVLIPMYKLNQNHQKQKVRIDSLCRRHSRRHTTVKFKVLYEEDGIFLKLMISTEDDNLGSEVADSEPPSEKSLAPDQRLGSDTLPEIVIHRYLEREDIEEARSFAQTLEITEASKSINYTPISPKTTKIKAMNMNDDKNSTGIKGSDLSYYSETLFLSENPIGLDIPAEQNKQLCSNISQTTKIKAMNMNDDKNSTGIKGSDLFYYSETLFLSENPIGLDKPAEQNKQLCSNISQTTKIKAMNMNDDKNSTGIKGSDLSYYSETLFLSENPIGLDIPAEQNNCDIDSLERKIELPEAAIKQ